MRRKINNHFPPSSSGHLNDLYKRFRRVFDVLLAKINPAIERQEYSEWYVSMPELEREIKEACDSYIDTACFLVGYTGIGKSTLLRRSLNLDQNPQVRGNVLYIPFFYLGVFEPKMDVDSQIRATSNYLKKTFNLSVSDADLMKFISDTKLKLLFRNPDIDDTASPSERLRSLKEEYRFGYDIDLTPKAGHFISRVLPLV